MPELWDYVESSEFGVRSSELPVCFLLRVAHYLGIEPLDNYSMREPLFDLQEGRFVSSPTETTLSPSLSSMLHEYLLATDEQRGASLTDRRALIDALIAYYQLHLSGFRQFHSHEILHTILK